MKKPGNNVVSIQPVAGEENPNRLPFSLEEMLAEFDNGQVPRSTYWKGMIRALYETANHVVTGVTSVANVSPDEMGDIPLSPYDINIQDINRDVIGQQLFFAESCKVEHQQGAHYRVLPGSGYVGGVKFFYPGKENIELPDTGKSFWFDVCWSNPSSTRGQSIEQVVVADELADYEDPNGVQHYVVKLADFKSDGTVIDRRNLSNTGSVLLSLFGDISNPNVDARHIVDLAVEYCIKTGKELVLNHDEELHLYSTATIRMIPVDFKGVVFLHFNDAPGLICGGQATSRNNPRQNFNSVEYYFDIEWDGNKPIFPTIQAMGVKGQELRVWHTPFLMLKADTQGDETFRRLNYSCAYSRIYLGYIKFIEIYGHSTTQVSSEPYTGQAWINENDFYLTSCSNLKIHSTTTEYGIRPYLHNNNRFHGGTFEGNAYIKGEPEAKNIIINHGSSNVFREIRFESAKGVEFASKTRSNFVEVSWVSSGKLGYNSTYNDAVIDAGQQNLVKNINEAGLITLPILNIGSDDLEKRIEGVQPALKAIDGKLTSNKWGDLYISPLIPIRSRLNSDSTAIQVDVPVLPLDGSSGMGIRVKVEGYDANKQLITNSNDIDFLWAGGNSITFNGQDNTSHGSNVAVAGGWITREGLNKASYLKITVRCGNTPLVCERLVVRLKVPTGNWDYVDLPPVNDRASINRNEWVIGALLSATNIAPTAIHTKQFTLPDEVAVNLLDLNSVLMLSYQGSGTKWADRVKVVATVQAVSSNSFTISYSNFTNETIALPSGYRENVVIHRSEYEYIGI